MTKPAIKVAAFVYVRSDSKRFPNKWKCVLGSYRLLEIVLKRTMSIDCIDLNVLTSNRHIDDEVADYCRANLFRVYRGDAFNLVKRTCQALEIINPDYFLRINGDSPLVSPTLINYALNNLHGEIDIISNIITRTFPYGVSVELVNAKTYRDLSRKANQDELEHVTKHLYRHLADMNYKSIKQLNDNAGLSLTIDNPSDRSKYMEITQDMDRLSIEYWNIFGSPVPSLLLE